MTPLNLKKGKKRGNLTSLRNKDLYVREEGSRGKKILSRSSGVGTYRVDQLVDGEEKLKG